MSITEQLKKDIDDLKKISAYEMLQRAQKLEEEICKIITKSDVPRCLTIAVLQHIIRQIFNMSEQEQLLYELEQL